MEGAEMKVLAATLISISLFASAPPQAQKDAAQADASPAASAQAESIKITRSGSQQPNKGPAEHFTGSVQVEELFPAHDPSRVNRSEEHTSELQSRLHLVCRLL